MWSHFLAAADVQAAVIRGDLEATMEAATWLAEYDEPGLPDGAEAFLRELQRAAARVIEATTSEAAGAATGRIAAACGSCHREFYPGMETTKLVEPPPGEGDIAAHMARHGPGRPGPTPSRAYLWLPMTSPSTIRRAYGLWQTAPTSWDGAPASRRSRA
jgi:hypothetical protein